MAIAHTLSPVIAPKFSAQAVSFHKTWYQKCHLAFAALLSNKTTPDHRWVSALPSLREMDSRMLDDVGAPQWARETVQRQRDERARNIEQILGGRHGCASPRFDPYTRVN